MKRTIFFLLSVLCLLSASAQKQRVVNGVVIPDSVCFDTVQYRVSYEAKIVDDTTRLPYQKIIDLVRLDVGEHGKTHFYSYGNVETREVINKQLLSNVPLLDMKLPDDRTLAFNFLTNYPKEGRSTYKEKLGRTTYFVEEDMENPDWEVVADSVREILGYRCEMARAQFHGRTWQVWYAEDIPLALGPWKLGGLPGLVLAAKDERSQYEFTAVGLEELKNFEPLAYFAPGKYTAKVSFKQLRKLIESYDPLGMLGITGNAASRMGDMKDEARKVGRLHFNPIELR